MDTEEYFTAEGWNIRYYRVKRGFTQKELADACDYRKSFMCELELGKNITKKTELKVCEQLGIEPWQLAKVKPDWRKRVKRIMKMEEKLKAARKKEKKGKKR